MRRLDIIAGLTLVACASAGSGYLLGSQQQPTTEMSELATAQLLTTDKRVQLIGFNCLYRDDKGDNLVTIISAEEDFSMDCVEIHRLDSKFSILDNQLN